MSSELSIAISHEQGDTPVTVLRLKGPLDGNTYKDLEARATEAREAGTRNLILDLSGVSYMGSAGLRAIHTISKSFNAGETRTTALSRVKLLTPSAEVLKVIKTLGFDSFLDIRDNIDDAVAAF